MNCPHSRQLNEALAQVYGDETVVFNEVSEKKNEERLIALYML